MSSRFWAPQAAADITAQALTMQRRQLHFHRCVERLARQVSTLRHRAQRRRADGFASVMWTGAFIATLQVVFGCKAQWLMHPPLALTSSQANAGSSAEARTVETRSTGW